MLTPRPFVCAFKPLDRADTSFNNLHFCRYRPRRKSDMKGPRIGCLARLFIFGTWNHRRDEIRSGMCSQPPPGRELSDSVRAVPERVAPHAARRSVAPVSNNFGQLAGTKPAG